MPHVGRMTLQTRICSRSRRAALTVLLRTLAGSLAILAIALAPITSKCSAAQAVGQLAPGSARTSESIEGILERARQGDAQAQYELAFYLVGRRSGRLASSEAVRWLRRAAEQGHVQAQSDLGLLYLRGIGLSRDEAEAAKWLHRAAEQGDASAQADLGQLYYLGTGVNQDPVRAAEWYGRAANQGFAIAQFNLASMYDNGVGVRQDSATAAHWYREAAERGLREAQHALALALILGKGFEQDLAEAVPWLRSAASKGLPRAQLLLAQQYESGRGIPRDFGQALRWYSFAANQGSIEAQRSLVRFYADGPPGIAHPIRAQMWRILAARNAPERHRVLLARERDAGAREMTLEDAVEAERLANQWTRREWAELQGSGPRELTPDPGATDVAGFFHRAGRNIAAAQLEYSDYWQPHIQRSQLGILEAARLVRNRGTALVLGAGRCWEIPLQDLAAQFDRVVLADLDEPSMIAAVSTIPPPLQRKVEIRVSDVTSFAEPLMAATGRIVEQAETAAEAFVALESLYERIELLRRLPDLPEADLVISSLVLSELVRYPSTFTARLVEEKFDQDLGAWRGYGGLWRNLRAHATEDHAEMLVRVGRPDSVVYFADTVGRGPDLNLVGGRERRLALDRLARRFAQIGIFDELWSRPESLRRFQAAYEEVVSARENPGAARGNPATASLRSIVSEIQSAPDVVPDGAAKVAEAASRLLCQDRIPVEMELSAFEAMMEAYEGVEPLSVEQLLDWDGFLGALEGVELETLIPSNSWKWLEYACHIPRSPGGFLVRSLVLRNRVQK